MAFYNLNAPPGQHRGNLLRRDRLGDLTAPQPTITGDSAHPDDAKSATDPSPPIHPSHASKTAGP